ncbi:MAG: hypothetical protein J0H02_16790 [Armatimonadetes bacterium]|nr:hypothetical protein [Armatimonadota bacterium]
MEIDLALQGIDEIIDWSIQNRHPLAFFACLYRQVTERVKQGILNHEFDDGPRMDRFDAVFAERYLVAFRRWRLDDPFTCSCWREVFEVGSKPIVLQHLLLGMNAHINLDLGAAAAEISTPTTLNNLRYDFDRINGILAEILPIVSARLEALSPLLYVVDNVGGDADAELINFSLRLARQDAWHLATELVGLNADERQRAIERRRTFVSRLARQIGNPQDPLASAVKLVRHFENSDILTIVHTLKG